MIRWYVDVAFLDETYYFPGFHVLHALGKMLPRDLLPSWPIPRRVVHLSPLQCAGPCLSLSPLVPGSFAHVLLPHGLVLLISKRQNTC